MGLDMSKQAHEKTEAGYYHHVYLHGGAVQKYWHRGRFEKILKQISPARKKILDLGCGPGTLLSLLPETYAAGYGVDFDEKQITFAKKEFKNKKKLHWYAGDVKKVKIGNAFDYIISSEVVEHISRADVQNLFKTMKHLLKKKGKIIITTPNYKSAWPLIEKAVTLLGKVDYGEQHINKYNKKRLCREIEQAGFTVTHAETFYVLSPFAAVLSKKLAKEIQKFEEWLLPSLGSVILVVAEK